MCRFIAFVFGTSLMAAGLLKSCRGTDWEKRFQCGTWLSLVMQVPGIAEGRHAETACCGSRYQLVPRHG